MPTSTDIHELRDALRGERLPAALVDTDAFDRNLAAVAALAGGKPVRLATKSLRVPALIRRALDFGPPFRGLMCFCAAEARALYDEGFDDLLIAYPTANPRDLDDCRALREAGAELSLVVDSRAGIEAAAAAAPGLRVVVELDLALRALGGRVHLGARRSPARDDDALVALFRLAADAGLRPVGVMAYEAQVAGLPDESPFDRAQNPAKRAVRRISMKRAAARRASARAALEAAGFSVELFNGGGTGSLNWAADEDALTELTAGSALYCPHLFDYYSNVRFEPSAFFALPVARASDEGFVTCAGGGYLASGTPGWDRAPLPWSPAGLSYVGAEGPGEVQTPLKGARALAVGDVVLFRHAKAGELFERFDAALLVEGGRVVDRVPSYRGRGWCFP